MKSMFWHVRKVRKTLFCSNASNSLGRRTLTRTGGDAHASGVLLGYDAAGRPAWQEDLAGNRTAFGYDPETGLRTTVTDALTNVVHTAYDLQGRVTNTWGATYPVGYEYDAYGRMAALHTWRDENDAPDVTHWNYDPATGLLTNKVYADGLGPQYAYDPAGRLAKRTWARGVETDYAYDALGQLVSIDYSDSTPDVAFTYDRLGRQLTITDVLGTRTNVYSPTDLLEERHPDGTTLVRTYDAYGRPSGIALGPEYAVGYGYDEYGRFSTVAVSNGTTFTYSYVPASSLLSGYTNDLGLAVTYEYEPLRDHKTLVSNAWSTNPISTFAYTYDAIGRRTQRIDDSTTTNLFGYNPRSELVSAEMGTNSYTYAYDPIGNRTETIENGLTTTYAANELNQYTTLNPGTTNSTPFAYDADGNMTSDGTWSYVWDAENRLIEVQPLVTNLDSSLVQYMYDAQSRRIARREFAWMAYLHDEPAWRYVQGRAYRYDDWNLLQELQPAYVPRTPPGYIFQTDLNLTGIGGPAAAQYVWGLDLSGTLHDAGGIGGLIMQRHGSTNAFCFHDIHGNVTELTDEEATSIAHYMYEAFGGTSVQTCAQVGNTPFRFSSKYLDWSIGFYYYGYRFYSQMWGRWLSRDIISELGGVNLYQFVYNSPLSWFDSLGASPSGREWYNQRPYNNEVGGPFVDVFTDTGSHVPHCLGFGGTGNTQGWTKQYRDVLVKDLPHRGAAEKIATILGELMREHGVTDDACYGGKVDQRVSIRHKTESFWIWKVCSRVVKLNKCHCGRCGGNNEMPDQLEDVTQDPSIYRCKQFMQSKTGSFIEMIEMEE